MKRYFCHKDFISGVTCANKAENGECIGGRFYNCVYKRSTPKFRSSAPMPPVKPPKRKSTDCMWCEHENVCKLKSKFNELKKNNYPLVCECENYKETIRLLFYDKREVQDYD